MSLRRKIGIGVATAILVAAIAVLAVMLQQTRGRLTVQQEVGEYEAVLESFIQAHGVVPTRVDNPETFYVAFWQSGDTQGVSHYYKMEDGTGIWVLVAQWTVQQLTPEGVEQ